MRHIISIHLEGPEHVQHIASLRWYETDGPNYPDTGALQQSTRQQMYNFVHGSGQAYALNRAKTRYAMLEPVNATKVQYVKTIPDGTTSDNLLSLDRY